MKITTLGPTQNFAALNPPEWLAGDLTRLAYAHPEFRLLTLFADDLPDLDKLENDATRHQACETRLHMLHELQRAHFAPEDSFNPQIAANLFGMMCQNAPIMSSLVFNPITQRPELAPQPADAPLTTAAIILLPRRSMTADELGTHSYDLPNALMERFDDVNIHRATLGHEWGHVDTDLQQPKVLTLRESERRADAYSQRFCKEAGDEASAEYDRMHRCVHNFFSRIAGARAAGRADASDYWNDLTAAGINATPLDEYAAQIEVKLRSANLRIVLPDDPQELVATAFNEKAYPQVHQVLDDRSLKICRLRTLLDGHDKPYKYQHSEELASMVIRSAYTLMPGAFR